MKWRPASFSSGLELKLTRPPLSLFLTSLSSYQEDRHLFFLSVSARRTRNFCNPLSRRPASSYLLCIIGRTAEKREEARQTPFLPSPSPSLWSTAGLPILSYFGTNIMLISHRAPAVSRDTRGCKGSPRSCVATLWIISKAGCARVKKLLNDYHWRLNGSFFFFLFFFQTWMANEVLDLGAVFIRGLKLLYSNFLV